MVKEIPPPPRLSARVVLAIGVCSDALFVLLYYMLQKDSFGSAQAYEFGLKAAGFAVLFGTVGTLVGSGLWARRTSNKTVMTVALGVVLLAVIYESSITVGFDDPRIMVFPFALLVVVSLIVGRVTGRAKQIRK